ncbi:NgoPII family restriction endonuclease [Leuconostoc mesenteroides]|uniref:NgoPII family restriction endonuclease n=1 Tax=Leuconostoc mesenteroides TaxID=1245 RepID=UPI00235FF564|nr:NgoPII family restriction endonuclease [Leuconostoc mesenteroides]
MMKKTNTLVAYFNILKHNSSKLPPLLSNKGGSSNAKGDPFEIFIKDMYCEEAQGYSYIEDKTLRYDKYLSWSGDSKHFPDLIIRNGEGIEPKKLETKQGNLSLNSSFPKAYIYPTTQNVPTDKLDEDSNWIKKNVVYAVSCVPKKINNQKNDDQKCTSIWLAYGNTFIADESVYTKTIHDIKVGIESKVQDLELASSLELGRVKSVDPRKNSTLRIRGMWELKNPQGLFSNHLDKSFVPTDCTSVNLVILKSDYLLIEDKPDFSIFLEQKRLKILEVLIPDPNNNNSEIEALIFQGYTE